MGDTGRPGVSTVVVVGSGGNGTTNDAVLAALDERFPALVSCWEGTVDATERLEDGK